VIPVLKHELKRVSRVAAMSSPCSF